MFLCCYLVSFGDTTSSITNSRYLQHKSLFAVFVYDWPEPIEMCFVVSFLFCFPFAIFIHFMEINVKHIYKADSPEVIT